MIGLTEAVMFDETQICISDSQINDFLILPSRDSLFYLNRGSSI